MTSDDKKLDPEALRHLEKTPKKNFTNRNSTMFLVLDAGIDMLIPSTVEDMQYIFISEEERNKSGWIMDRVRPLHERLNKLKDEIVHWGIGEGNPPNKYEFRMAFSMMHQYLNPRHPIGNFYRNVIEQSFRILGLGDIEKNVPIHIASAIEKSSVASLGESIHR